MLISKEFRKANGVFFKAILDAELETKKLSQDFNNSKSYGKTNRNKKQKNYQNASVSLSALKGGMTEEQKVAFEEFKQAHDKSEQAKGAEIKTAIVAAIFFILAPWVGWLVTGDIIAFISSFSLCVAGLISLSDLVGANQNSLYNKWGIDLSSENS